MKKKIRTSILVSGLLVATLFGVPALAIGVNNGHANAQELPATTTTTTNTGQPYTTSGQAANRKAVAQTKLADAKLKACQNREKAINNIMSRISDRGQKQITLFGTIASETETFYTNKGKALSNYDSLLADLSAKKDAAQTAVDAVKTGSSTFTCGGDNPKGAVSGFVVSLKSEITALNNYKTSVKNLIVGVKSVQSTTATNNKTTGGN